MRVSVRILRDAVRVVCRVARTVHRGKRGIATLEFALVAAPLLFVLFAIIESGLIFIANINLSNATLLLSRQLRTGSVMASGAGTKTAGVTLSLADFKTAICKKMSLVSLNTCIAQLQVDIRTQSAFGNAAGASSPVTNGNFNTSSLCYYSGASGNIVEFRTYYLWPIMTPALLSSLVNVIQYTVDQKTTIGTFHVIVSSEAFRIEQNSSGYNAGNGC